MSSRDATDQSSSGPLLRFRIPPPETAFSLASPSGNHESPAWSIDYPPLTSRTPFYSHSSHRPSIRTFEIREGIHPSTPYIGSIQLRRCRVSLRRTTARETAVLETLSSYEFNLSRSLSQSKGRRNRCQLFTAPANTSGGYSIRSGRSLGRQRSLKSTYR